MSEQVAGRDPSFGSASAVDQGIPSGGSASENGEGQPRLVKIRRRHKKRTKWHRFVKWVGAKLPGSNSIIVFAAIALVILVGVWMGLRSQ